MIQLYSTQNPKIRASLEEAVMSGLAADGGLYMPVKIPQMPSDFFKNLEKLSLAKLGFEVSKVLLDGAVPLKELESILDKALNFDAPLKEVSKDIFSLELFHGPTLSFKDFGARFMAQLMSHFVQHKKQEVHILVATSGDTGSAIAHAFLKVPGIKVHILYPKGRVSWSQEKQLTTMGHNITALEVHGSFDDCQRLVKEAFQDSELRSKLKMSSANSINIARLIPQSFYYFYAFAQIKNRKESVIVSVPSGNFGNLTAGLLAKRMGLGITHFVAATNINDSVPQYLSSGKFESHPSRATLSNAMDVGNPSNFARMLDLYGHEWKTMKSSLYGESFTDEQTKVAMNDVLRNHSYILDPHGAVAYLGLKSYLEKHRGSHSGIFLETAHPGKFADDVEKITHQKVDIPKRLQDFLKKEKKTIAMSTDYRDFKKYLIG